LSDTQWAGVSDQYYQTVPVSGGTTNQYVDTSDPHWLKGIWVDDTNSITGLPKT